MIDDDERCTCQLRGDDADCPEHGREAAFWARVDYEYCRAVDK